jgi:hypothetical protein
MPYVPGISAKIPLTTIGVALPSVIHMIICNSSNLIRQSLLVSETEPGAGRGSHPRWDRDPPSGETEISE